MRLRFADCVLDLERFELRRNAEIVEIEPKVLGLLTYLAHRPGKLVTRDELFAEGWPGVRVSDSALSRVVKEARRAVGDDGTSQQVIETVRGRGFRFSADVRVERGTAAQAVPFVGRTAALRTLEVALLDSSEGRGRLAAIVGHAGIGKTRTVQELAARARAHGASVHTGRALESDGAAPLWPWVQIVRSVLEGKDETAVARLLGSGSAAIAQAMPTLASQLPDSPATASDPQQESFRLFDELTTFVRRVSGESPVVLVLEDAHRADLTSLRMLSFAAHQLRTDPVLIVVTYRDTEAHTEPARGSILEDLLGLDPAGCVELAGLDPSEVQELASALTEQPIGEDRAGTLHRATGGNPLFVHQLASLPIESSDDALLTAGVRAAIRSHVHALSEPAREVLRTASVLGRDFDVSELGELLDQETAAVLASLENARLARLVMRSESNPLRFEFVHALIRDALYEEWEPSRLQSLHARTAKLLERRFGGDLEPHLARIAHHHETASPGHDVGTAVAWLVRAGDSAAERIARHEAADFYERALILTGRTAQPERTLRCELYVRVVENQRDGERALAAAESAVEIASELGNGEAMVRAALALDPEYGPGLHARWVELQERVIDALGPEQGAHRAMLLAKLAHAFLMMPGEERARDAAEEAMRLAREIGNADLLANSLCAGLFVYGPQRSRERLAIANEIAEIHPQCADPFSAGLAMGCSAYTFLENGDFQRARQAIATALGILEPARLPIRVFGYWVRGTQAMHAGELDELDATIEHNSALARTAIPDALAGLHISIVAWWRESGRLEQLVAPLEGIPSAQLQSGLALIKALLGRHEEASALLEQLGRNRFEALDRNSSWIGSMTRLAETAYLVGHTRLARDLYEELVPFEDLIACGAGPDGGGCVARELALLSITLDELDQAQRHMQRAIEVNNAVGLVLWAARCRGELADILSQRGERQTARQFAEDALLRARTIGMPALERECAALL